MHRGLRSGYPKGRIVEIYGPESSGKTTMAIHAIAEVGLWVTIGAHARSIARSLCAAYVSCLEHIRG